MMPLTAQQVVRKFEDARYLRGSYESLWREVAWFCNNRRDFLSQVLTVYPAHGGRDLEGRIYDSVGGMAADELTNILYSYVTPPTVPWFEFVVADNPISEDRDAQNWLLDLRNLIMFYLYRQETGFPEALQEFFLDYVTFGTTCMYVDWYNKRLRTITRPLDENYIMTDAEGRVIVHFRQYTLSVEQAYYRFPDTLPEKYKNMFLTGDSSSANQRIRFIHYIGPSDSTAEKFDSIQILYDDQTEVPDTMTASSYDSFPYICPRWKRVAGEAYGRGPGVIALPGFRVSDKLTKLVLQATEVGVLPPTQEPEGAFMNPSQLYPGKRNYYKKGSRARIETVDISGDVRDGREELQRQHQIIERIFFLDVARQFSLRGSASPLKATEVIERRDEVLRLLGPIVARLTSEFLAPLVERIYTILDKKNLIEPAIGPPPASLNDKEISPAFSSAAAMSMRRSEIGDIRAWLEDVAIVANFDPGIITTLDGDAVVRKARYLRNVDPDLTRTREAVQSIRSQQAQNQQLQQLTETVASGGAAASAVAEGVEALSDVG